jgi:hypothetical protein
MKGVCWGEYQIKFKETQPGFATGYLKIREPISFFILHFSFLTMAIKNDQVYCVNSIICPLAICCTTAARGLRV